jgi:hypothetical protein
LQVFCSVIFSLSLATSPYIGGHGHAKTHSVLLTHPAWSRGDESMLDRSMLVLVCSVVTSPSQDEFSLVRLVTVAIQPVLFSKRHQGRRVASWARLSECNRNIRSLPVGSKSE